MNDDTAPASRYTARLANEIERKWQDHWEEQHTFWAPNPSGALSEGFEQVKGKEKLYVLDMFPYPSGAGLHVGHPLGYIGTDVYARFQRMNGRNVLHALGYDAFGLPAEQYALETGQHPRTATEANIANMRRQLRALGLGHDPRRSVATTDVAYYRWTQWIFLQIFESWYDAEADRARPIAELVADFEAGRREPTGDANPDGTPWSDLDERTRREVVNSYRLAFLNEAVVNWCPGLGTVLANEEVTADGRSDRGNFPVFKKPLKQWTLRITAYAERLLGDLDLLDWPDPIKLMQRNWIGRSVGATIRFPLVDHDEELEVFTTRPDTVFGATYMVLAPEHPLVDALVPDDWPSNTAARWKGEFGADVSPRDAVAKYREFAGKQSEMERQAEGREKTGVFTGAFARNPLTDGDIPIFIADYVLMGYGTGAIMAVPGQDERDWEFAEKFDVPIVRTVAPPDDDFEGPYLGDGPAINSGFLDGLNIADAKHKIGEWLVEHGAGAPTINYKLRDWLFSRQRYWGEPFPIVYGEDGLPRAVPASLLPVELPDLDDFRPAALDPDDAASDPAPPLARAEQWLEVVLDLGDGPKRYLRETNTMPQWAGSCWYFLRYLDPTNEDALVDREIEEYWMPPGGVDLYVGGVEHAVLHLLYARFWQKVLFDLGHVSTVEPFHRLYNQGYIQAFLYRDQRGIAVEAAEVEERDGKFFFNGEEVTREFGKMGKGLKNTVAPDDIYRDYGADTLRLYEMFTGPLDASRPWSTTDIIGVHRFLQRLWRNVVDEDSGEVRVSDEPTDEETRRLLHRTISAVRDDMGDLKFNTAIARLFELNNRLTQVVADRGAAPREVVEPMVLMLAPLTPHVGEELWQRLGRPATLAYEPFPEFDPALLVEDEIEVPVQINGKVRATIRVPSGISDDALEAAARADERIAALLEGATVRKVIVVPGRLVNFVIA
ncbi:MAG: leucine--tRNA ligase [Acidimicrobiia bacterium]|nr:leucine--tRNA ligase [Acidimicrobiia bacterium]